MYATVADLRAEGVTTTAASDARLLSLIDEATKLIDRITGWYFEPRDATYRMDGRGAPSILPPAPPIRLTRLTLDDAELSLLPVDLIIVGAPVAAGSDGPRLTLRRGRVFRRGEGNVVAVGRWGFTEPDGSPEGVTPPAVKRACMLLVLRNLAPLNDAAAHEARTRHRVIEEETRDQRYRLDVARPRPAPPLTGDPDVDVLLEPYLRPIAMGSA